MVIQNKHEVNQRARPHIAAASCECDLTRQNGLFIERVLATINLYYQTSLGFKWLKVVQSPNGGVFECHLNTRLNLVQYSDHHLTIEHHNSG